MAIGKRIKYFRKLRGLTQKELGTAIDFKSIASDVRIAQYESETRVPKYELITNIAHMLKVSPDALAVPNIDTYTGIMHTLFALEDMYGLRISDVDGQICLTLDKSNNSSYTSLFNKFLLWHEEYEKFKNGEITREEYDHWRYTYPQVPAERNKKALDEIQNKSDPV